MRGSFFIFLCNIIRSSAKIVLKMITVSHLKKTYIGKHNTHSRGLVDVSFTLPEKGFVFVLGKSGSGKSTLLNLLGGLDTLTDGKIYLGKKDFSSFTEKEKREYKASFCGFIFQDYKLIDELTVKENIALSLELISDEEEKEKRIDEILKEVDLVGYENRYPKELSGGQKQRVAIARALIKKPKFVLCDEPTGNLDQKTSKQILDLLKRISKDCLVFMVSHDEKAAFEYADKKITLEEGLVIKEEIRDPFYENKLKIEDGICYLPFNRNLTEEETNEVEKRIESKEISSFQTGSDGFVPYQDEREMYAVEMKQTKCEKKTKRMLSKTYVKKGILSSTIYSFLFSFLTLVLALMQTLVQVTPADLMKNDNSLKDIHGVLVSKYGWDETIRWNSFTRFNEADKEILIKDGIKNYPITNHSIGIGNERNSRLIQCGIGLDNNELFSLASIYPTYTLGSMFCDEDYLKERFSDENHEFTVLAGSLEACKNEPKLVITDFIADAFLDVFKETIGTTYDDVIDNLSQYNNMFSVYANVGAIIKTDYKEKYKNVFDQYEVIKNENGKLVKIYELMNSKETNQYKADIINGELSFTYIINPHFYDEYNKALYRNDIGGFFLSKNPYYTEGMIRYPSTDTIGFDNSYAVDHEIVIPTKYKNNIEKMYGSSAIGQTIYLYKTDNSGYEGNIVETIPLKIKGYSEYTTVVSLDVGLQIMKAQQMLLGYYFPKQARLQEVINKAIEHDYTLFTINALAYTEINSYLNVFDNIFIFLQVILITLGIVFMVFYCVRSIKNQSYQIGVFKSLGVEDTTLFRIFGFKNIIFAFLSILFSCVFAYPLFSLANVIMSNSFAKTFKNITFTIHIFTIKPPIFLLDFSFLFLIFILFSIIPFLYLKRISPAKIVNNKDE